VDVRVEKISDGLAPFFLHSFKRINGTVGTTDMEKDLHLLARHSCRSRNPVFLAFPGFPFSRE
jgi:hypothetical protein